MLSSSATAAAQMPGLNGFALCTSKAPKETGYVEGSPVYFSDVFQVYSNNADYDKAYAAFLQQRYHFSGPLNCSVAYAKDGQVRTLNQRLQTVGSLAVRTGWSFASGGAAPAPATAPATHAPSSAVSPSASSASALCFVATPGKQYFSAIFDAANEQKDKGNWETACYNYVHARLDRFPGNSACMVYPSAEKAQQAMQIRRSQLGAKLVETGWVYKGPEPATH